MKKKWVMWWWTPPLGASSVFWENVYSCQLPIRMKRDGKEAQYAHSSSKMHTQHSHTYVGYSMRISTLRMTWAHCTISHSRKCYSSPLSAFYHSACSFLLIISMWIPLSFENDVTWPEDPLPDDVYYTHRFFFFPFFFFLFPCPQ